MTISIMLDLETWGKRPGCDIRSIGACVFDPVAGYVAGVPLVDTSHMNERAKQLARGIDDNTFYIACENPVPDWYTGLNPDSNRKYPLQRDPDTMKWWSEQSEEAQSAFADPVDLRDALVAFDRWLAVTCPMVMIHGEEWSDCTIYAHGPQFDISILAAAYEAVDLPVPWHYRAPRDTRTVFDLAGIDDHSAWLKKFPGPLGVPHHALEDSISQARAVCAAWQRIKVVTSN